MAAIQVTANELNAIKTLALSQASIVHLGDFNNKNDMVKQIKKAKKTWWTVIRSRYHIPAGRKLSVELDGDRAGELRTKAQDPHDKADISRRIVHAAYSERDQHLGGQSERDASESAARIADGLNEVLSRAGIDLQVRSGRP